MVKYYVQKQFNLFDIHLKTRLILKILKKLLILVILVMVKFKKTYMAYIYAKMELMNAMLI